MYKSIACQDMWHPWEEVLSHLKSEASLTSSARKPRCSAHKETRRLKANFPAFQGFPSMVESMKSLSSMTTQIWNHKLSVRSSFFLFFKSIVYKYLQNEILLLEIWSWKNSIADIQGRNWQLKPHAVKKLDSHIYLTTWNSYHSQAACVV